MDAREQLRRYLEQRRDAGERELTLDTITVDQVLRMIGSGKRVSQIAAELSLSGKTVSTHRARILVKMSLATTAELMYYVITSGLLP